MSHDTFEMQSIETVNKKSNRSLSMPDERLVTLQRLGGLEIVRVT